MIKATADCRNVHSKCLLWIRIWELLFIMLFYRSWWIYLPITLASTHLSYNGTMSLFSAWKLMFRYLIYVSIFCVRIHKLSTLFLYNVFDVIDKTFPLFGGNGCDNLFLKNNIHCKNKYPILILLPSMPGIVYMLVFLTLSDSLLHWVLVHLVLTRNTAAVYESWHMRSDSNPDCSTLHWYGYSGNRHWSWREWLRCEVVVWSGKNRG